MFLFTPLWVFPDHSLVSQSGSSKGYVPGLRQLSSHCVTTWCSQLQLWSSKVSGRCLMLWTLKLLPQWCPASGKAVRPLHMGPSKENQVQIPEPIGEGRSHSNYDHMISLQNVVLAEHKGRDTLRGHSYNNLLQTVPALLSVPQSHFSEYGVLWHKDLSFFPCVSGKEGLD